MAKLTPHPHREYTKDDPINIQLGPPSELFTHCEQTFNISITEDLWPGNQPLTEDQIRDWIAMGVNPRIVDIQVTESEERTYTIEEIKETVITAMINSGLSRYAEEIAKTVSKILPNIWVES